MLRKKLEINSHTKQNTSHQDQIQQKSIQAAETKDLNRDSEGLNKIDRKSAKGSNQNKRIKKELKKNKEWESLELISVETELKHDKMKHASSEFCKKVKKNKSEKCKEIKLTNKRRKLNIKELSSKILCRK